MRKIYPTLLVFTILFILFVGGCTKDRDANINYFKNNTTGLDSTAGGGVVINEFLAAGSSLTSELSSGADWIELYNTSDSAINFANTNYYISDDSTAKGKFVINKLTIPGKGFMVVFCDDSAQILTQVHTNFGLSKTGEFVGLYTKDSHGNFVTVTSYPFGAQTSGISVGRYPDGGATWQSYPSPTPGSSNHL